MKNADLPRYPAASPSRRRGKKSLLIRRDATPLALSLRRTSEYASFLRISGAPADGISQGSTCICLPARSPALRDEGRDIFDQPGKQWFFGNMEELQYKQTRKISKGGDNKT
jgi:hypothetical protein